MPKLKLNPQYFGCMMQRADSLRKTLIMGKIEGKRRREQQRMKLLHSITDSMYISTLQEVVERAGHDSEAEQQQS